MIDQTKEFEQELQQKTELVEEATQLLTNFDQEKHDVKAKFKHLMQFIVSGEDSSEYQGRPDEVDLNQCFERLEEVLMASKHTQETKIG